MNNSDPQISFITVNYNGYQDTIDLIESIKKCIASYTYEIIVVDNASSGDDAFRLMDKYPWVKVVVSAENLGFAGGNNLGLKEAKGKYVYLINNDTYFKSDVLPPLVDRLESDHRIAIVCPKIIFADDEKTIQFAGYTPLTAITLRNSLIGFGETDAGQYNKARLSPFAHGAAMFMRREVLDNTGFIPECYFLYYEELDWSEIIYQKGYIILYEPDSVIFHKESRSTGRNSPLRTYYITRNRLIFAKRNRTGIYKYGSIIYQLTLAFPKAQFKYLIQQRSDLMKASAKAVKDFLSKKEGI